MKLLFSFVSLGSAQFQLRGGQQDFILTDYTDCEFNNEPLPHAQLVYVVGDASLRGSVYARCWDGEVICFVEDAIPDKADNQTIPCEDANTDNVRRRLQLIYNNPWPLQTLCYEPPSDVLFSESEVNIIGQAFHDIENKTNVRFVSMRECNAQVNALEICGGCQHFIEFIRDHTGCYSSLGYQGVPNQLLSLGLGCFREGVFIPIHELGHAMGMFHEHSHPDRALVLVQEYIPKDISPNNFMKLRDVNITTLDYDLDSVMHYPLDDRMCIPKGNVSDYCDLGENKDCIVATEVDCNRNDTRIERVGPDKFGLSLGDIEALAELYPNASTIAVGEGQGENAVEANSTIVTPTPTGAASSAAFVAAAPSPTPGPNVQPVIVTLPPKPLQIDPF